MNITQIIQNYIKRELLIVSIVVYFVGMGIERREEKKVKYIPIILGIVGVLISAIYVVATSAFNGYQSILMAIFTSIVQGILVAGLSVYANQIIKQTKKSE